MSWFVSARLQYVPSRLFSKAIPTPSSGGSQIRLPRGLGRRRAAHAERAEDLAFEQVGPGDAGSPPGGVAGRGEQHGLVVEGRAEVGRRLQEGELADALLQRPGAAVPEQI